MTDMIVKEGTQFETKGKELVAAAGAIIITSNDEYRAAVAFELEIKNYLKELDAEFDDNIRDWHEGHKKAVAQKKKYATPADDARRIAKQKCFVWEDDQEKLRRQEEDRLRAEAQKKADDEALAAAEAAEKAGDAKEAEAILATPVVAVPVVVPKSVPKITGHVRRMVRKWRYKNVLTKQGIKPEFMIPDEIKIGGLVRSMGKAAEGLIGGIEVYEEAV